MPFDLGLGTAILFAFGCTPQTLAASFDATTLEGARQTIALHPVASEGR